MTRQLRIGFVALESVHPTTHGGKVRMAGLIDALQAAGHTVYVYSPETHGAPKNPKSLRHFLRLGPRQGSYRMSGGLAEAVRNAELDVVMLSISYLAPFLRLNTPTVIDFQNIERDRYRSMARYRSGVHRYSALLESIKAALWEPRVARSAALTLACTEEDAGILRRWGASVALVPHGTEVTPLTSSPNRPVVGYLASGGYPPNDDGGRWLIEKVWPLVRAQLPRAELRIIGAGTREAYAWGVSTDGLRLVGEVPDLAKQLSEIAVLAGPVRSGGGAQLKVVTALAYGRTMVVSPHTLRSVPEQARPLVSVAANPAAFAGAIIDLLRDPQKRHETECALHAIDLSWLSATAPLIKHLEGYEAT